MGSWFGDIGNWTWYDWLAQAIGFLGVVSTVLSFQCKDSKKLLILQGVFGSLFWGTHFAMLSNWSGCLMHVTGLIRTGLIYYKYVTNRGKWMVYPLCVLMAGAGVVGAVSSWNNERLFVNIPLLWHLALILLPVGMIAYTIALWTESGVHIRNVQLFFASPLWFFNNLMSCSIAGIVAEIANDSSVIVSWIRYGRNLNKDSQVTSSKKK